MNRCIAGYWKPVFYFLRAKGYPFHRAEDLTQEFFFQLFQRDWIRRADPQRGRFRTFLLTVLTRFLADQRPPRAPRQKSFDDRMVCISALIGETERTIEPPVHETPEEVFMKQWARAVIDQVRRCLELWCQSRGRPDWYQIFCASYFPAPGSARATQHALADRFHLTRDQIRYALEEVDRQFIQLLRGEVSQQVDTPLELDCEIRDLQELLGD